MDLSALRHNVDVVAARVGPEVGILAVVKADAYGHGALACARALERKVWGFAVSLVEEGIELRRGGIEAPIVVLGSFYGFSHRDVIAYRLTPVVSEPSDLEKFARAADELAAGRVSFHLKIDTGMSRLGLSPERLPELLSTLVRTPSLLLSGLCTHLADADGEDEAPTREQLARFAHARAELERAGHRPTITHVANSAGLARFVDARFDLVRPGLALYGYAPERSGYAGLKEVMSLKSKIVALREIARGTRVSYGGLFRAERPSRIATVPVGYADGYTRRLTGRADALVGGRRCRIAGAVTMDMSLVDVTDAACALGDEVVLLGAQGAERISAEELARHSGTIPWEIFCGISKRVPRVYVGERP